MASTVTVETASSELFVTVSSMVLPLDAKRAYYPVYAGLFLRGKNLRALTDTLPFIPSCFLYYLVLYF